MTIESYLALFTAMMIAGFIPGPGALAITSTAIAHGFSRGAYMTLGLVLADCTFILLSITGLTLVAEVMGSAFVVIKYLCAGYLFWLGLSIFLPQEEGTTKEKPKRSKHSALIMGYLITISNPKAIVFYVALFPAFVDIQTVSGKEIIGILCGAICIFGSINLFYSYISAQARRFSPDSAGFSIFKKLAGIIMMLAGASIATKEI